MKKSKETARVAFQPVSFHQPKIISDFNLHPRESFGRAGRLIPLPCG